MQMVQLLRYLVSNGSMEHESAKEERSILHGDEKELEEPLLANLLHGKVIYLSWAYAASHCASINNCRGKMEFAQILT